MQETRVGTKTSCPCCGVISAQVVATKDGKSGKDLLTVSCEGCGIGRIDPLPSEEDLEEWYENHYREEYKNQTTPKPKYILRAARNALERVEWLENRSLMDDSFCCSLDIGASSGEFVYLMQKMGIEAHGIEPHVGFSDHAKSLGLDIKNGILKHCLQTYGDRKFDLITMFHVLEHLADPVGSLKLLGNSLSHHGLLYIEVPNAERKSSPTYMFFKAHTFYFTQESLAHLMEVAGFEVLAQNDSSDRELKIVVRPSNSNQTPISTRQHAHELVAAQKSRKWISYLMSELAQGQPYKKIATRRLEAKHAKSIGSARQILEQVYETRGTDGLR